jgi:hypothetical protein
MAQTSPTACMLVPDMPRFNILLAYAHTLSNKSLLFVPYIPWCLSMMPSSTFLLRLLWFAMQHGYEDTNLFVVKSSRA